MMYFPYSLPEAPLKDMLLMQHLLLTPTVFPTI